MRSLWKISFLIILLALICFFFLVMMDGDAKDERHEYKSNLIEKNQAAPENDKENLGIEDCFTYSMDNYDIYCEIDYIDERCARETTEYLYNINDKYFYELELCWEKDLSLIKKSNLIDFLSTQNDTRANAYVAKIIEYYYSYLSLEQKEKLFILDRTKDFKFFEASLYFPGVSNELKKAFIIEQFSEKKKVEISRFIQYWPNNGLYDPDRIYHDSFLCEHCLEKSEGCTIVIINSREWYKDEKCRKNLEAIPDEIVNPLLEQRLRAGGFTDADMFLTLYRKNGLSKDIVIQTRKKIGDELSDYYSKEDRATYRQIMNDPRYK